MRMAVRRHRKRNPFWLFGLGAVVTVVLLAVAVLVQPPPLWHPGQGAPPSADLETVALQGPPTWLRIRTINVDAPLVPLGLDKSGELEAPKDYDVPGWYADGTPPGDTGPAVIAGHVDSLAASAVFRHLADLRGGDLIEVQRGGVWLMFTVVSTERYPKSDFPTARVYGPTPDAQLRVITCGGSFDHARNSYRDNVVVFAMRKSNDH
jgi:LPXTG-site transpeptidase (sortase) family protein